MKMTTKGRYALRIMLDIAQQETDLTPLNEVSRRQNITPRYTERLSRFLSRSGLIKGVRGRKGGVCLTRSPREYTIWEILLSADEDMSITPCANGRNDSCRKMKGCHACALWRGYYHEMEKYFSGITLQDLIDREQA
ncbi:MAG: Rrf2 family transcriptional regulator [Bacillota bacterium]|nr:Rrf2 family transcriptional regulator [Bacillota bacterium]